MAVLLTPINKFFVYQNFNFNNQNESITPKRTKVINLIQICSELERLV